MSYKKMIKEESRTFFDKIIPAFEADAGDHGGKSDAPNLSKWLDHTKKLFEHLDEISRNWGRGEIEMIKQGSKNAVSYGDPKESAYFALHKDILSAVKKLQKARP